MDHQRAVYAYCFTKDGFNGFGVIRVDTTHCAHVSFKNGQISGELIECDILNGKVSRWSHWEDGEEKEIFDLDEIEEKVTLDDTSTGKRWEGEVVNGEALGYGIYYDGEGNKQYEGFRKGLKNICFGREFYEDEGIAYEGMYCDNIRQGEGKVYSRSGELVYEGYWMNGEMNYAKEVTYPPQSNDFVISTIIEEVRFEDWCIPDEVSQLDLSALERLRIISFGKHCFKKTRKLLVRDLSHLESMETDTMCFHGVCEVIFENLPSLYSIVLGNMAFFGDIREERREQSLESYHYKNILIMRNLPSLSSFILNHNIHFYAMSRVFLENLPNLRKEGIEAKGVLNFYCSYDVQATNAEALEMYIKNTRNTR